MLVDLGQLVFLFSRPRVALAAENLFLHKQLALFQERKVSPRRADDSIRWTMAVLSRVFDWRSALVVVKPGTLIRRHRKGFRLFWGWKSRPVGRPRSPKDLQGLIRKVAGENPTCGEERITNELKLKFGIRVSRRTVEKYLRTGGPLCMPDPKQRWPTLVHNHAKVIVACDFFVVVAATFRTLYVLVMMELGTRKTLHCDVTARPTAEWTLKQFRETLPDDNPYHFMIHDRDTTFSKEMDRGVTDMGVRVLQRPVLAPKANPVCGRLVGTARRECLNFFIPLGERRLRRTLQLWTDHYNRGRPHMSLGPGFPVPVQAPPAYGAHRHGLQAGQVVRSRPVLGGLHHEYWLEKVAA